METETLEDISFFDFLPDDTLAQLFCVYLNQLGIFSGVSKRWLRISQSPYVWYVLVFDR